MKRQESRDEYLARMKRFDEARAAYQFYETGIGSVLPNAAEKRQEANNAMWDNANAPAWDEYQNQGGLQ